MKFCKAKIQECVEWVEQNGLYPQRCGASIKQFCEAMGIGFDTFQRWNQNANFANAISRAREVFKQRTVQEVSNALVKAAKGYEFSKTKNESKPEVITEYDPKTGKKVRSYPTGKLIPIRSTREVIYVEPNVHAACFLLTNMDPDNWKNKVDGTTLLDINMEDPPVIVFGKPPQDSQDKKPDPAPEG